MSGTVARVDAFLQHYASEYYDPAKAREYYLRTRELKGRQTTSGMSDEQRQGWSYAKNQIAERKKADLDTASESRQATVEQLRAVVQKQREQISAALQSALQQLSDRRAAEAKNISAAKKADLEKLAESHDAKSAAIREAAAQKIAALPPIPKGVSDDRRAQLTAQRAQKIAKINGDAWGELVDLATDTSNNRDNIVASTDKKRTALAESTTNQREKVRGSALASREALASGMKSAVDKARSDYEARKEQIKADYEAAAQREYDGLRANLPSAPKKSKSKKSDKDAATRTRKPGTKVMTLQEAAVENVRRMREAKK